MELTTEDRHALCELIARYNFALDHHDAEGYADTFVEDGALIGNGQIRAQGKAALIAYVAKRRAAGGPKLRHWSTHPLLEGDGSLARLRLYVMAFNIERALEAPYVMSEYEDEAIKVGGKWRFSVRRFTVVAGGSITGK